MNKEHPTLPGDQCSIGKKKYDTNPKQKSPKTYYRAI